LGADALLLCLSSPFKIASSGFVSSLQCPINMGHIFKMMICILRRYSRHTPPTCRGYFIQPNPTVPLLVLLFYPMH
ncbi:hypothetical protein GBM00_19500, partial [Yersinia pseudotuberculosis]|nr:hypothetical protein [Yersinia pseudotuberculosis]MBO1567494.1 hypothetical protein [Yersinia pseudotuberculosis]MBO1590992.1 hypothetical protein [Yersinia pseudotuberculosis]MBO1604353.1 hypothetical protein [Yersinia pseudotuberculosis]MBO1609049.1 hypothetical protein [Yersinia pseudotuberculosis]